MSLTVKHKKTLCASPTVLHSKLGGDTQEADIKKLCREKSHRTFGNEEGVPKERERGPV